VTSSEVGWLLLIALALRVSSALVVFVVPRVRGRISTTEVGYVVAGLLGLAWAVSGEDPATASLTAVLLGLAAGGIGATLSRRG